MHSELFINIANFTIKVVLRDSADRKQYKILTDGITSFFEGFITHEPKETHYTIEIADLVKTQEMQLFQEKKHYVLFYEELSNRRLRTYFSISIFQFQLIVQNVIYKLLSQTNGFFLHSSASQIGDNTYIFLGESGAGKSTIATLLKSLYPPLSDDLSIIRKIKNDYIYFQHPFKESHPIKKKNSKGHKVEKVFFLIQDKKFSYQKFTDTERLCQILLQQLFSPNRHSAKDILEFGAKFADFYTLCFAKDKKGMCAFMKNIRSGSY